MDVRDRATYLVALPTFPGQRGFSCRTILVRGYNSTEAFLIARSLRPNEYIGDIKKVDDYGASL